jgi:hypothetical protein
MVVPITRIVFLVSTSTINQTARNLYSSLPRVLEGLVSTSPLQTLLYSTTATGILRQTFKRWIVHTALVKQSKYTSSVSLQMGVWRNACLRERHKSCAWINWLYNRIGIRQPKVDTLIFSISRTDAHQTHLAANKEELLDMIQHGADNIVNSNSRYVASLC